MQRPPVLPLAIALVACGGRSRTESTVPDQAGVGHIDHDETAGTQRPVARELALAEAAAYEKARPVFERYCVRCHDRNHEGARPEALEHFEMTSYPFGGHHAAEIGPEIRDALGIGGGKPTMPMDHPGSVMGDELAAVAAWADAWDRAHAGGAHHHDGHEDEDHDHPGEHAGHAGMGHGAMEMHDHGDEHAGHMMMDEGVLGIPTTRDASGTAWQPDATPMHAFHLMAGGFELMFHGLVFLGYDAQGSDRGDEKFFSPNWLMAMAHRRIVTGDLMLRTMISLDAVTMGEKGYPLLLQSGESVDGEPLVDRQHPHDLFMEVAASYTVAVAPWLAVQIYGGPVGEPALGPVAFPHRLSSAADPLAVLGHHWQDSTHISFGVVTAGLVTRAAKLEGSWFNGREPDQDRYDFDLRGFDSYSARLTINPAAAWSAQASYGRLDSPEALEPDVSVQRVTASVMHVGRPSFADSWATTAVWGRNIPSVGPATDGALIESSLAMPRVGTVFGRGELVRKTGDDLDLPPGMEGDVFSIGSLVAGYLYELQPVSGVAPGFGVRGSLILIGDDLAAFYGTHTPAGVMAFVRLQPAAMSDQHEM